MNQIQIFDNFIDKEDCLYAINLFDSLEKNNKFPRHHDKRLLLINPKISEAHYLVKKYSDKILNIYKNNFVSKLYLQEFFLAVFPEGASLHRHVDADGGNRSFVLSAVLYFNDDFEGGEIVFPNLDFVYKPKIGSVVCFPSYGKNYEHEVHTLTKGKRYTIPISYTLDKEQELLI